MKKFYLLLIMNMVCGVLNGMESEAVQKVDSFYSQLKRESTLLKGLQHWLGQGVEQSSDRALDYLSKGLEGEGEETFQLFINVISEHELEAKHRLIPLALLAKFAKRFIENGIDGGVKDTLGKLALHFAAKSDHRDLWSQEILDLIWINRDIFPEDVVNFVAKEMMKNPGIRAWVFKNITIPVTTLKGHTRFVKYAIFSPDGKHVVTTSRDTAAYDSTGKIWDSSTGDLLHSLRRYDYEYNSSVAFSPDGEHIVTASYSKPAKIWDSSTGELLRTLEGRRGSNSAVYSPDGKSIVTASRDMTNTAKIWDSSTGELLCTLEGHTKGINSVVYCPNGEHIVTASNDNTARIWDPNTGELLHTLEGHTGNVFSAVCSPDGKSIVTVSWKTPKIWDPKTGKCLQVLKGHTDYVNSAVYSPDGKSIVTASSDGTAKIWDPKTGKCLHALEGHAARVFTVSYSPDGKHVVTASFDKTAKIWDSKTGEILHTLEGHTSSVSSAVYSPDGKYIVTASNDNTAKIWDSSLIDFIENELSPKQASLILPLYKEQNTSGLKIMLNRWQKDLQIKKTPE